VCLVSCLVSSTRYCETHDSRRWQHVEP
jgi:hypothetical protein